MLHTNFHLHNEKVVWCSLNVRRLTGSLFYVETINSDRYVKQGMQVVQHTSFYNAAAHHKYHGVSAHTIPIAPLYYEYTNSDLTTS